MGLLPFKQDMFCDLYKVYIYQKKKKTTKKGKKYSQLELTNFT